MTGFAPMIGQRCATLPHSSPRDPGGRRLSILSFASLPTCGPGKAAPASTRVLSAKAIRKAALSRRSRELPTSIQATLALGKSRPSLLASSSAASSAPAIVPPYQVAQEVFPWLSYANDNGRLVHESPPAAPAPSTAADTATRRVAAPPTRRTEVTPHIRLPRSFAEAPPPRDIWSDPAPEPEPTPGANATPAALPQPYFADERMLDMVHSLQLHQGLAMLTASAANPDQGIARALLLNSLNETLEFLDNLRVYVEDME